MKVSWVLSDEERKQRIIKKQEKKKTQNSQILARNARLAYIFTTQEEEEISQMYKNYLNLAHIKYYEHFAEFPEEFQSFISGVFVNGIVSEFTIKTFEEMDEMVSKNFVFELRDMSELTAFDKMTLISENYKRFFGVWCVLLGNEKDLVYFFQDFVMKGQSMRETNSSVDFIMKEMEKLSLDTDTFANQIAKTFSPLFVHEVVTQRELPFIRELYNKTRTLNGEIDYVMTMLMLMVMIFHPDGVKLERKKVVQNIQEKYVWQLHRYLTTKYGAGVARGRLHAAIMLMTYAEELYNLYYNHLTNTPSLTCST